MRTIPSNMLQFVEHDSAVETAIVEVVAKGKGVHLGEIRWAKDWKGYAFYPSPDAAFSYRALADITSQLIAMMDDWARATGRKPTHGKSSPYRPRQKRCNAPGAPHMTRIGSVPTFCGRWAGHTGPHRSMGSDEAWEG